MNTSQTDLLLWFSWKVATKKCTRVHRLFSIKEGVKHKNAAFSWHSLCAKTLLCTNFLEVWMIHHPKGILWWTCIKCDHFDLRQKHCLCHETTTWEVHPTLKFWIMFRLNCLNMNITVFAFTWQSFGALKFVAAEFFLWELFVYTWMESDGVLNCFEVLVSGIFVLIECESFRGR